MSQSCEEESVKGSESGEEVTLWLPLVEGVRAKDIRCDFRRDKLSIWVAPAEEPRISGGLKGRAASDDCYWVIDDDYDDTTRHLQVVLAKAGSFTFWDGVLTGEENILDDANVAD